MATHKPKGLVFLSYAHDDRERVRPLVDVLAARFNVWWDRQLDFGEAWRRTLADRIDQARCLVVVWTKRSVKRDFVFSEVARARANRGVVVPVKLDRDARIPLGFDEMQHLDLSSWSGGPHAKVGELVECIGRLMARPPRRGGAITLAEDRWTVRQSQLATKELLRLSGKICSLAEVLVPRSTPSKDLLGSLREVDRTYQAVGRAIATFLAPAGRAGRIALQPYLAMERGTLGTLIERNRGHCTRIVEYYGRVGGLRDWLESRLPRAKLKEVDGAFGRLGEADNDLFADLARMGDLLTAEASAIVGLLLANQSKQARVRLLGGRKKLLPLERELTGAIRAMHRIQSTLGYVPRDSAPA